MPVKLLGRRKLYTASDVVGIIVDRVRKNQTLLMRISISYGTKSTTVDSCCFMIAVGQADAVRLINYSSPLRTTK